MYDLRYGRLGVFLRNEGTVPPLRVFYRIFHAMAGVSGVWGGAIDETVRAWNMRKEGRLKISDGIAHQEPAHSPCEFAQKWAEFIIPRK